MNITRIIYRSHLLPPFVTPFNSINSFMEIMHHEEYSNIVHLKLSFKTAKLQEKRKEFAQVNQTIQLQLRNFREKYIFPLQNCPTFYDIMNEKIVSCIEGGGNKLSYIQAQAKISKREVYSSFRTKYNKFKEECNEDLFKEVKLIPPYLFNSPQEMYPQAWSSLSADQQNISNLNFVEYLQSHEQTLKQIAWDAKISLDSLLKIMKNEFSELPSLQAKKVLFP